MVKPGTMDMEMEMETETEMEMLLMQQEVLTPPTSFLHVVQS